jgi:hypothetical protein
MKLPLLKALLAIPIVLLSLNSCQKRIEQNPPEPIYTTTKSEHGHLQQTKTFSSGVAQKWQDLQLRMLRTLTTVNPYGRHGHRYFGYCGIALYESVVPGMPAYQSLYGQLTDMPVMPSVEPGKEYHWPTSANAALAYMNKHFFTSANTSPTDIAAMTSLEDTLNAEYQTEVDAATFQRSKDFGRTVAERIFAWSTTDGSLNVYPPYIPAALPLWTPTAPNPTAVADPNWGKNRPFVQGSATGTAEPLPPPYSTDPNSAYYAMVKEVYDVSLTLTHEDSAAAIYFRDNPGYPNGAHYISIFSQVMHQENPQLDFYALAHAKAGIAFVDAMINTWQIKFAVLLDRPTRYIRNVLGHPGWTSVIPIPPHPEFPNGHSEVGSAVTTVLTELLGEDYHFTLHTYDYLGMAPRSYNSFEEMEEDIGSSSLHGGIDYTYSSEAGAKQGQRIAMNILRILKFKKE